MSYRPSSRDIDLLHHLFLHGKLSRIKITDQFFSGNLTYSYRRLQMLKSRGWIKSKIGRFEHEDTWKTGAIYELMEDGRNQLILAGKITPESSSLIKPAAPKPRNHRNRPREWTHRDISLLHEVYNRREMSKAQCLSHYFANNKPYGSKRIEIMRKERLLFVVTKWSRELHILQATVRITERGLQLLIDRGLVHEGEARARDLGLSDKQRSYILDAHEISFQVNHIPYLDSRAIKRKYNLNRGDLVLGSLCSNKGDYMLYILTSGVFETTVRRIASEIQSHKKSAGPEHPGVAGYLIYYKDEQARQTFERYSVGLVTGGVPIHLLPLNDRGIFIAKHLIFGDELMNCLKVDGQITRLSASKYSFEYGVTFPDGTTKYLIECLTGNKILLERILREYKGVTGTGRKNALLFCWEEDVIYYQEKTKEAHYIEIMPVKNC